MSNTPRTVAKIVLLINQKKKRLKQSPSAPPYMTREQDNKNFNNPFIVGAAVWQSLMTYWFNAYGEFLKNAPKMAEEWYNMYWKPWLNWMPRQQEQQQDRVKIE